MRTILTVAAVAVILGAGSVRPEAAPAAAQDQTVYQIGDSVKAPVLIKEVKPRYTADAMRRRVEGVVELTVVVRKDGTVGEIRVIRSLDPELDEEAINAAAQWRFRPGTKDDQPVNVQVNLELTFTIKK